MICVKCNTHNTFCIDDMLQIFYVAEIYACHDCGGTIEVLYHDKNISTNNIKEYKYIAPKGGN
jgi:hypothetical protein